MALLKRPVAAPKIPTGSINRPVINPGSVDTAGKIKTGSPIDQYLTNDPTYQMQQSAILKALGDYRSNELNAENTYNSQYGLNTQNINEQNRTSGIAQQDDYASRGMLRSGLYGVADADRQNNYARQQSQLDMSKQAYITGLRSDTANYQTQQQLAQQQARQDAINRRALALTGSGSVTGVV